MASSDIQKLAVADSRILQLPPRYAVQRGALSLSNSPYNAIAATSSQHTYNVNAPSQNVFIARDIDWSARTAIQFSVAINSAVSPYVLNQPVVVFGRDCALAPYPLHQMVQTMTTTINDVNTTINTADVLDVVLRLADYKNNRIIKNSPSMLDRFGNYDDAYLATYSPLNSYIDATEGAEQPNGAWGQFFFTDSAGVQLSGSGNYAVAGQNYAYVNGVPVRNTGVYAGDATYPIFIKFFSTERLILPPYVFNDEFEMSTGLFGVNNIQLICNMKSDISRLLRFTSGAGRTISGTAFQSNSPFTDAKLNVQYLTPSLNIPLPEKSTVPYLEYPRYINTNYSAITAGASTPTSLVSSTIVLPQIPDMLLIYCKPQEYLTGNASKGDQFMPISGISLNFDNFSGLLSSHTPEELYRMAVNNGLMMDYNQWSGKAQSASSGLIQTSGGFLVLRPGKDFALQTGQAPGILGNYVINFTVQVSNTASVNLTPALYVVAVNSGFFQTMAGSSRIIKGVLSEADILDAPLLEGDATLSRMVGAGFMDKLGSFLSKAKDIYTATKPMVSQVKGMLPETGALGKVKGALGAVGYGQAGAGLAGASMKGRRKSITARLM